MTKKLSLRAGIFLALTILLVVVLVTAVAIGSVSIPVAALLKIIISPVLGVIDRIFDLTLADSVLEGVPETWQAIVLRLRLPRVIAAMQVGAALALAGGTMQGLFKNPLADPYIIGVSSGAAVGAAAAILAGIGWNAFGAFAIPLAALFGGIGALVLVYTLASEGGKVSTVSLLLAGIAVSTFLSAIVSMLIFFSGQQLQNVVFWMMGGFSGRNWFHVNALWPWLMIGGAIIIYHSRDLDALAMGEEQAHYMGVNVEKVKTRLIWAAALLTAAAVSVSGLIGFVGLVIPHAVRLVIGPIHRWLLPTACLAGAVYLAAADLVARTIISPIELPVGLVTALVGGPFFLYLLKKRRIAQ